MTPGETAVVLVRAPDGAAPRIATALVEERLAACVNLVPGVQSWMGESVAAKGGE